MGKIKILIVDDESGFLDMIKNYFSLRGYEVFTALRAAPGLEIIKEHKPEVVLIDLKLPGIDGDQLFRHMKEIHPKGKAIIVTAYKDEGKSEKKLLGMGVFGYFEKPIVSMKEFEATVKKAANEVRGEG